MVTLNQTPVTINSWSDTAIVVTLPPGASSGRLLVAVAPAMNDSNSITFTVTTSRMPSGWLDRDIGLVGAGGSGTYANGTFTIQGAGSQIYGASDAFHFVYQPLSGDGTIVARLAGIQGNSTNGSADYMSRQKQEEAAPQNQKTAWPHHSDYHNSLPSPRQPTRDHHERYDYDQPSSV